MCFSFKTPLYSTFVRNGNVNKFNGLYYRVKVDRVMLDRISTGPQNKTHQFNSFTWRFRVYGVKRASYYIQRIFVLLKEHGNKINDNNTDRKLIQVYQTPPDLRHSIKPEFFCVCVCLLYNWWGVFVLWKLSEEWGWPE